MKTLARILALVGALAISASVLSAQTTGTTTTTPPTTMQGPHMPNVNASDTAKTMQTMLAQFEAQRDQFLAARKALMDKMKTATPAEKKQILDTMKAELQNAKDQNKDLAKQLHQEMMNLRKAAKTGG